MINSSKLNSKNIAKITLVIIFLLAVKQFVGVFQTRYQLVSPLIPESVIAEIIRPLMYNGVIAVAVYIAAQVLYLNRKYIAVMVLGAVVIIWVLYLYPYFYF